MMRSDRMTKNMRSFLLALQHLIVALPSTVLVALLTGFPVATTLFCCGISNIVFYRITQKKVPLMWGASFAFIPSLAAITGVEYGVIARDDLIASALVGILAAGGFTLLVGLAAKHFGNKAITKLIPPVISGSVAIVIGVSLSTTAVSNLFSSSSNLVENSISIIVGLLTLLFTVWFSACRYPVLNRFSIILGISVGCIAAALCSIFGYNLFTPAPEQLLQSVFQFPHVVFPWQAAPGSIIDAVICVFPVAIITLPETVAHVYQADLTASHAMQKDSGVKQAMDRAIISNGIEDCLCAFLGGTGVTSYGENLSVMSISNDFSAIRIVQFGLMLIILSFFSPLCALFYCIPKCVIGAVSIYLFGMIICQGIGVLNNNQVDLFEAKNLSIISIILIIGIGGLLGYPDGRIYLFGIPIPAIALASFIGIIVHYIFDRKHNERSVQ